MTAYDFETLVDRRGSTSSKWHLIDEEMGKGNEDVLPLSVADMEFKPAPEIVNALVDAAKHDIFGYDYATDEYLDSVIGWMKRRHGLDIRREWIRLSDGVMPAVNTALRALTHPGDAVIVQQPVYYPFMNAARNNGLTILNNALILDEENGRYSIDFDDLERKAADPRCTAMLLCNPHNPVGRVWTEEELRRIGDICIANNVVVLADEIHADFAHPGHKVTMFGGLGEPYASHCLTFTAPTKTFNLAGLACSNAVIRDEGLRRRFDVAADNIGGMTVSHFGLVACMAAYNHAEAWFDQLGDVLEGNLALLREFAAATDGLRLIEPEGTYLAWLDCRELGMSADELCEFMRVKARIYFDEGAMFGPAGEGFERINLACPRSFLEDALGRVAKALAER